MNEVRVVYFLHQLRIRVLSFVALENVIIRFEVNEETPKDEINLIILFENKKLTFPLNDLDIKNHRGTLEFVMKRIYKEMYLDK